MRVHGGCQQGLTRERGLWCGGALERGDGATLEPLAQLGDALSGVGAVAIVADAAELVEGQAASTRVRVGRNKLLTGKQVKVSVLRVGPHEHT